MIHSIHDGSARGAAGSPFVIYGFGGSINNFTDVVYPGQINRCDACHQGTSYYPVNDSAVQATTRSLPDCPQKSPNPTTAGQSHRDLRQHVGLLGLPLRCAHAEPHDAERRLDDGR